ncbi:MAG: hypothetical protein QMB65_11155, partial [Vicingaceae bacterium]
KKVSLGIQNPNITFYLIRRNNTMTGMFSNHNIFLKHIYYALKNNYIPVVDMQYEESCLYHEENEVGVVNAWELYFEQPTKYKLKDVLFSKNVVLSSRKVEGAFDLDINNLLKNKKELSSWIDITSNYLKYNIKTIKYLDTIHDTYIPANKKILGVSVRSGYITGTPKGHPIQPNIIELIEKTELYFIKYNYDFIFLSVEDYNVVVQFKKKFKDHLIIVERPRLGDSNSSISKKDTFNKDLYFEEAKGTINENSLQNLNNFMETIAFDRKDDKYLKGLEYLSEMYILSKLDGLICGETSGTVACVLRNKNGFDNLYFYNLGVY